MKYIELSKKGKYKGLYRTIVDDENYEELNKYNWSALVNPSRSNTQYARRTKPNSGGKLIMMHRVVINCPDGFYVDHINGDGLDNRKENLRICTDGQNKMNRIPLKNTKSKYKGVLCNEKCISAAININGKKKHLGTFKTEEEAAKAYDEAAKIHHGGFAYLNFNESLNTLI